MKAITQPELLATLDGIKGATFATIVTETDARLKKTGNPFGPVRKVSRVNVTLGFQYASAVNRQRTREGSEADFESAPRQWGERVTPMLVEHKGRTYLETKVENVYSTEYYTTDGRKLSREDVAPFLPSRSGSSRQKTEKEIVVRDYAIDSIRSLAMKGEEFIMLQPIATPIPAQTQKV